MHRNPKKGFQCKTSTRLEENKMKEYVTEHEFIDRFRIMDRESNFSYYGRKALFHYFEDLEEQQEEDIEFDCIAICCEYSEYDSLEEFQKEYNKEDYPDLDSIGEATQLIEIKETGGFIIQQF